MDVRETFAKNLRAYRKKAGLSQEKLGQLCGLHRTYIGGIEQKRRNASLKNVGKIANALNIPPVRLFIELDGNGCPVFASPAPETDEAAEQDNAAIPHCFLATWENDDINFTPLTKQESDLSVQILSNLVQLGYSDRDLLAKYNEIWPQIKNLYGI